jgi:hypothetical protein
LAGNEAAVVEVRGKGLLDIAVWRQAGSMTVHLVNLTNPMMMKGPYRETYPVGPLTVYVPGVRPKSVRLLTAETELKWRGVFDGMEVTVPVVDLHEVVAIDL